MWGRVAASHAVRPKDCTGEPPLGVLDCEIETATQLRREVPEVTAGYRAPFFFGFVFSHRCWPTLDRAQNMTSLILEASQDLSTEEVTEPDQARSVRGRKHRCVDYTALMRATQAGDQDAYRELLQAVQPMLFGYLRKRLRSPEAAEDVSQEVLLTMHRVRHTFEPNRPFEPWFFSIARSRLIDHLRRVKRVNAHESSTDVLPEVVDDQAVPDWERFLEVLEILPDGQREAFSLLKIEGLSTVDAAERVGISVSALKVRAHRAYKALKKGLEDEEST
ncbi:MAG: RNA polymerase sigma-70 factor (ECF subfamily) [Hyphomicrobiaceae bacterium]|jgi:RNA polymerase sigma-70 factor (ECF subfamily)